VLQIPWDSISFKNSIFSYVLESIISGIRKETDDRFYDKFIKASEPHATEEKIIKLTIANTILAQCYIIIDRIVNTPYESLRLILSSQFPPLEKYFYQFHYTPESEGREVKNPSDVIPRFKKNDLAIMVLSTYLFPVVCAPMGIEIETLLCKHEIFKNKLKQHTSNMNSIGVLKWYYNSLTSGVIENKLIPSKEEDVRDAVCKSIGVFDNINVDYFLFHFGYELKLYNNPERLGLLYKMKSNIDDPKHKKIAVEQNILNLTSTIGTKAKKDVDMEDSEEVIANPHNTLLRYIIAATVIQRDGVLKKTKQSEVKDLVEAFKKDFSEEKRKKGVAVLFDINLATVEQKCEKPTYSKYDIRDVD
jgi:hypothetical protein